MVIVRNRISFFTSDQNQTEEPQQTPPWVKEMKDKGKSFRKPDQKEEPEIKQEFKQEYKSPSQKEAKVCNMKLICSMITANIVIFCSNFSKLPTSKRVFCSVFLGGSVETKGKVAFETPIVTR